MSNVDSFCVVIADDHAIIRAGIRSMIRKIPEIVVIGEAADGIEALRLVHEQQPDLLVLDLNMPNMDGMEVARRLRNEGDRTMILMLSAVNDREMILGMLELGVAGYIAKEEAPEKLLNAIRELAEKKAEKNIYLFNLKLDKQDFVSKTFPK